MRSALFVSLLLVAAATTATAAPLHGEFPDARSPARDPYKLADHPGAVYVIHHYGVETGCNGELRGPVAAEQWFDQIVTDYGVTATSRLQVLDVGELDASDWLAWWQQQAKPNHPVLIDTNDELLDQVKSTAWPDVIVVDCQGVVRFKQKAYMTQRMYEHDVRPVIDQALADQACGG